MAVFSINGYDSYSGCDIVVTASLPLGENNETTYFTLGSLQTLSVSTHQDKRPVRSIGNINAKDYVMGQRTIAGSLVFAVFDRHFADKIMKTVSVMMPDEIPALNLTVNFANEYGRSSRMAIYGVKLINEGQVMSINDLYTENTYQFVALGMEMLTADVDRGVSESSTGSGGKPNSGPNIPIVEGKPSADEIITKDDVVGEVINSDDFQASGGKIISDRIRNNSDYSNEETIILYASVEQPSMSETTGIVTLTLHPIQREGFIYVTNLITGDTDCVIQVNNSASYNTELPIGYYNAIYMNTTRTKESNIEKIIIRRVDTSAVAASIALARTAFPVIENITSDSISVSMYSNAFNDIICYTSGSEEKVLSNNNKTVVFKNLRPNTEYNIYATNETAESNIVTLKTFPNKNTYYSMFKDFLKANRNMLYNDYDAVIKTLDSLLEKNINDVSEWNYDNIINGLLTLENNVIKQELLLYGAQFENSMLESYNINNPYKLNIIRNDIFDTNITVNNWDLTKYYSIKDGKSKLEGIINPDQPFNGLPNRVYSLYGIADNTSSVKKYLTVFTAEGKEALAKYRETNKYKTLDLSYNKDIHPALDSEGLYALTIRDANVCDKQMLEEPYVYEEDGIIYADITYDDKVMLDDTYYLCISEMYSTLDTTPCRKVAFNQQTKLINLTDYYIPFDMDHIYHIWIESFVGNVISKTFIFNYKQSIGLSNVLDKELLKILDTKKRLLMNKITNANNMIIDVINDLYSSSVPMKNLDTRLEYEILYYSANSYYISDPLYNILYETALINISSKLNISRANQFKLYKNVNQFYVTPTSNLDIKVVTKSFNLNNEEIICSVYNTDTFIDILGDFMTIYLINPNTDKVLGMIVLNCNDYRYRSLGFNVEVGDR